MVNEFLTKTKFFDPRPKNVHQGFGIDDSNSLISFSTAVISSGRDNSTDSFLHASIWANNISFLLRKKLLIGSTNEYNILRPRSLPLIFASIMK